MKSLTVLVAAAISLLGYLVHNLMLEGFEGKPRKRRASSAAAEATVLPSAERQWRDPSPTTGVATTSNVVGDGEPLPVTMPGAGESHLDSVSAFHSDEELWASYQVAFELEPLDANFVRQAREVYLPAIQQLLPESSRLVTFECRSEYCRAQVVHDSIDIHNSFMMNLFARDRSGPLADSTAGFRVAETGKTADGKLGFDVFIAARGASVALLQDD